MMNEYDIAILQLAHQGYCCAQIILHMALDLQGSSNPALVRAMSGLCHGVVGTWGACGAMTGAACLIASYGGKGTLDEDADERLPLMLNEFYDWFRQYCSSRFTGINCADIVGDGDPDPMVCGGLVSECFGQAMAILAANGYDPARSRDV